MDKLRVGIIVFPEDEPTDGGKFSYFTTLLHGINEYTFSPEIEIYNIVYYYSTRPTIVRKKPTIYIEVGRGHRIKSFLKRLNKKSNHNIYTKRNPVMSFFYYLSIRGSNRRAENILKDNKIDLVYYLKQQEDILNYPFIATIWDVSHKSTNGFPEHTMNRNYEFREKFYQYVLNKAFLILCESKAGAEQLKKYYSFYDEKIKVLPIFPGSIIELDPPFDVDKQTLENLKIEKESFFLYPAQFWPHKNHYNLLLAFHQLIKEKRLAKIKLILPGSDKGNKKYIEGLIADLGIAENVVLPGFLSNEELCSLYKNALALTMPTFLGPTNLPILEALHFNCPVLCSDLEGHKEIMGEHALYFQPENAVSIAAAMEKVLEPNTRKRIITGASNFAATSRFNLPSSLRKLDEILLETKAKRKAWGYDYFLSSLFYYLCL